MLIFHLLNTRARRRRRTVQDAAMRTKDLSEIKMLSSVLPHLAYPNTRARAKVKLYKFETCHLP